MVHQHFVATILTILLVGTVPVSLILYNNSGLGINIFSNHNFAYAVQNIQTENNNNNDSGNSERIDTSQSEASDTSMLQEKVKELLLKANTAETKAAKAINAANKATVEAESLSSTADEADKDAKQVLKSIDDEDKQKQDRNETETEDNDEDNNNDEVNAVLNEVKEKRKAANLAEEEARDLSDKADSLNKAAKRTEKLAEAALKELENAKSELSNSNQKTNRARDNAAATANENEDANKKKDKAKNNSENDSMHKKSDKIQSDITSPGVDKAGSLKKKNQVSIENNSRVDVIQTQDNMSKDMQGKASGSTLNEILAQAENSQIMRSDQSPAVSVVNNSISTIEDHYRGGLPEVTREVNSSTSVNRSSILDEIIKRISNVTDNYPSNNEAVTNSYNINPISTNDNATSNSSNTNKSNATTEYEGKVYCNVIPDNATIADDNSGLSIIRDMQDNGDEGGCYPRATTSGDYQYVVWSDGDEDNRYILFKRSVNGKAFEDTITLSGNVPSPVFNPKVTSDANNVYVVWQGDSESGNQDILMRKSEDNGKSFGDVVNLSNDRSGSGNPEINVNSTSVYVVWDGTTPGNNDIYFRKSINNGSDFDKVRNLSTDGGISYEPKVVVHKKGLEIYWLDYRNGHEEVLAKKSLNEGRTFEILQKLDKHVFDLWKDRSMSASRS